MAETAASDVEAATLFALVLLPLDQVLCLFQQEGPDKLWLRIG